MVEGSQNLMDLLDDNFSDKRAHLDLLFVRPVLSPKIRKVYLTVIALREIEKIIIIEDMQLKCMDRIKFNYFNWRLVDSYCCKNNTQRLSINSHTQSAYGVCVPFSFH